MLLTQSPFCCAPIIKPSIRKHPFKTKRILFGENENNKLRSRNIGKPYGNYVGDTRHSTLVRSKLAPILKVDKSCDNHRDRDRGIGINDFFKGKNIFVTGATGLLGKALVEKLLRSTSVCKIYLLMKASDKETAIDRLSKEITESKLFECVREKHGISYVREKLIPVVGNVCERNLGMDVHSRHTIMEDVDVIIHSAAMTTYFDRYDLLLDANVNAPQRLMMLAKGCKNLKLFVHISTGMINILDIIDEIELAMKSSIESTVCDPTKHLKSLTLERASFYGFNNGYQLSKCMGEMILGEIRGDVPLLVIRPTVIESSYKEPVPGWIQGNRRHKANVAYAEHLCKAYEHMGFFKARFHNGNIMKLLEEMSEEERDEFFVDATKIDWKKYFVEIHIPGLRKYVLHNV